MAPSQIKLLPNECPPSFFPSLIPSIDRFPPLACEANVLVFYSLHVEPDGGNRCHHFPELELVEDGGLTSRVQTHLAIKSENRKQRTGARTNY